MWQFAIPFSEWRFFEHRYFTALATQLRCGGILQCDFVANLPNLLSLSVKEF